MCIALDQKTIGDCNNDYSYTGINTGQSNAGSSGGENQTCSSTLALFSMYALEILGRGNQPQGWEISVLPTL